MLMPFRISRYLPCLLLLLALPLSFIYASDDENNLDPWEGFNRITFKFNDTLDNYALRPLALGYTKITPKPMQYGIHNVFNNLGEIKNLSNNLLQANFLAAGKDTSRFLINSTLGILGLFDVASNMGMERSNQDFGITLARWGVPSGPYLVLPFLGPSTVRDSVSLVPDGMLSITYQLHPEHDRYYFALLNGIDMRASLLDAEKIMSGDKYLFLRNIYLQNRAYKIDGEIEDDF